MSSRVVNRPCCNRAFPLLRLDTILLSASRRLDSLEAAGTGRVRTPNAERAARIGFFIALSTLPELQLVFRQRVGEGVCQRGLALEDIRLSPPHGLACNQARDRCAPAGNDDILAGLHLRQQSGQLRLGFVDVHDGHRRLLSCRPI